MSTTVKAIGLFKETAESDLKVKFTSDIKTRNKTLTADVDWIELPGDMTRLEALHYLSEYLKDKSDEEIDVSVKGEALAAINEQIHTKEAIATRMKNKEKRRLEKEKKKDAAPRYKFSVLKPHVDTDPDEDSNEDSDEEFVDESTSTVIDNTNVELLSRSPEQFMDVLRSGNKAIKPKAHVHAE